MFSPVVTGAALGFVSIVLWTGRVGVHAAPHPHDCQSDPQWCCKPYTTACTSDGNVCKKGDHDCYPWSFPDLVKPPAAPTPPGLGGPTPTGEAGLGGAPGAPPDGIPSAQPAPGAPAPIPGPSSPGASAPGVGATGLPSPNDPLQPSPKAGPGFPASGQQPPLSGAQPSATGLFPTPVPGFPNRVTATAGASTAAAILPTDPPPSSSDNQGQTTGTNLGLAIGLPIALIIALALAAWLLMKLKANRGTAIPQNGTTGVKGLAGANAAAGASSTTLVGNGATAAESPPMTKVPGSAATASPTDPAAMQYGNIGSSKLAPAGYGTDGVVYAANAAPRGLGTAAAGGVAGAAIAGATTAKAVSSSSNNNYAIPQNLPLDTHSHGKFNGTGQPPNEMQSSTRSLGHAPAAGLATGTALAAGVGAGAAAVPGSSASTRDSRGNSLDSSTGTAAAPVSTSSRDVDALVSQYSRNTSLSSLASTLSGSGGSGTANALAALAFAAGVHPSSSETRLSRPASISSRSSRYLAGVARRGTLHTKDHVVTVFDERTGHVLDKKTVTVTQYDGDMHDLEAHTAQIEIAGSEIAKVGETVIVEYADSSPSLVGDDMSGEAVLGGTVLTTVRDNSGDVVSIRTTSSRKDPPSPGSTFGVAGGPRRQQSGGSTASSSRRTPPDEQQQFFNPVTQTTETCPSGDRPRAGSNASFSPLPLAAGMAAAAAAATAAAPGPRRQGSGGSNTSRRTPPATDSVAPAAEPQHYFDPSTGTMETAPLGVRHARSDASLSALPVAAGPVAAAAGPHRQQSSGSVASRSSCRTPAVGQEALEPQQHPDPASVALPPSPTDDHPHAGSGGSIQPAPGEVAVATGRRRTPSGTSIASKSSLRAQPLVEQDAPAAESQPSVATSIEPRQSSPTGIHHSRGDASLSALPVAAGEALKPDPEAQGDSVSTKSSTLPQIHGDYHHSEQPGVGQTSNSNLHGFNDVASFDSNRTFVRTVDSADTIALPHSPDQDRLAIGPPHPPTATTTSITNTSPSSHVLPVTATPTSAATTLLSASSRRPATPSNRPATPSLPFEYEEMPDLSAYHPPAPTSHVCVQPYYAVRPDEMPMQVGDLVGIEREYPDGWARGQNITHGRKRGLFPLSILTPIKSGPSQRVARVGGRSWLGRSTDVGSGDAVAQKRSAVVPPREQSLLRRSSTNASKRTLPLALNRQPSTSSIPEHEHEHQRDPAALVGQNPDGSHQEEEEEEEAHILEQHTEKTQHPDGTETETTRTLLARPSELSDPNQQSTNLVTRVVTTAHTRNGDGTLTKRVSVSITDVPTI